MKERFKSLAEMFRRQKRSYFRIMKNKNRPEYFIERIVDTFERTQK